MSRLIKSNNVAFIWKRRNMKNGANLEIQKLKTNVLSLNKNKPMNYMPSKKELNQDKTSNEKLEQWN
jgi:hypothetical protein